MNRHQKVSVVWELLEEPEAGQENRVFVDVDAPLRPFGDVPLTHPKGVLVPGPHRMPSELLDEAAPALAQRGHRLPRL